MPSREPGQQAQPNTATKETVWAANLDAEQLAARLVALAADLKALPDRAQRTALWLEAAKRIYDGTPVWKVTTLPTAKQMQAATSQPTADSLAEIGDEEAAAERAPRRRKTGHPPTNRAHQAARDGAA